MHVDTIIKISIDTIIVQYVCAMKAFASNLGKIRDNRFKDQFVVCITAEVPKI